MINDRYDAVMTTFSVGDTVHWTSQSGGVTKTKQGVIAAVIPAGMKVRSCVGDLTPRGASLGRLGSGPWSCRDDVSYVVRVRSATYYWPMTSLLHAGPAPHVDHEEMPLNTVIRHLEDLDRLLYPSHTKGKRREAIRRAIAILSGMTKATS